MLVEIKNKPYFKGWRNVDDGSLAMDAKVLPNPKEFENVYGFIVEGFNDESKVFQVLPHSHIAVTKGTRFNNRVRMDINALLSTCTEVFVLTDPDDAGQVLAEMIQKEFPQLTRLSLDANECQCYRNNRLKIGVEHCDATYLATIFGQANIQLGGGII